MRLIPSTVTVSSLFLSIVFNNIFIETTTTRTITSAFAAEISPTLPFGDINVLVVTDVHSFVGGHSHDPRANANYGDVVSLYEHLKAYSEENNHDFWFVMNGDWMHGTGLAMDGNAQHLMPILNRMPWDAITLGNHESYSQAVVELMQSSMLPAFEGRYLTSNVKVQKTNEAFGRQYMILEGKNNRVMVMGFIYNHCEPTDMLKVKRIQEAVEMEWFTKALQEEDYDAILILAHMDVNDPYVNVILSAIRQIVGETMPVQFITGHTHIRAETTVDLWSHSFEAGAFMDTVGFVSFPNRTHAEATPRKGLAKTLFGHVFMDGSVQNFTDVLQMQDVNEFATENGTSLTKLIRDTQEELGLTEVVACPPFDYTRDMTIHGHRSIYNLWRDHVAKEQVLKRDPRSVMMISKDAIRHDIRGEMGSMVLDDVVAIAPFMEPVLHLGKIPAYVIRRANSTLNTESHNSLVPDFILSGDPFDEVDYDFYTQSYSLPAILEAFERLNVHNVQAVHTGERDTLYWLRFLENDFPCEGGRKKQITPWFKDIHKLNEEAGDSHFADEDSWDEPVDEDILVGNSGSTPSSSSNQQQNQNQNSGYQGYLPPSTIEHFKDVLPPGSAPSDVHVVGEPTEAPHSDHNGNNNHHSAIKDKKSWDEQKKKQKKIRKTIIKILALIVGILMLLVPIYCFVQSILGRNQSDWDEEDGLVYDRREMKALKLNMDANDDANDNTIVSKNKKTRGWGRGRSSGASAGASAGRGGGRFGRVGGRGDGRGRGGGLGGRIGRFIRGKRGGGRGRGRGGLEGQKPLSRTKELEII